ncbi:phosphomannomutase/phosphoglucomutase [Paludibacter sp.]|uniref:phosphomannomutase/phosphoglucomutase n=1 Tax=Paludibacter sp. TaxID=1898105 RepID=UPI0013521673|nr:phosphomannomutase/phosphoglucomutase [Paludibacter sp.]MTK53994.1 phosphomannomutase/phosphoglucomutase [Paludibacter sp.]
METNSFLALQNGSDIRGIATEGIAGQEVNLTPERVTQIAIAFVDWLAEKKQIDPTKLCIGVGRDSRISGESLMTAFVKGVRLSGANAVDCGIASTPAMYMSTIFEESEYDGAAMLTASHLPFNRNGLKFFTSDGGLDKPDITAILSKAATVIVPDKTVNDVHIGYDLIARYSTFLVEKIRKEVNHSVHYETPLKGFRIVVDAGNGAGGFFVDKVLQPLGAYTTGSQFLDPDGMFPNHIPNPEDETAMSFIQKAVLKNKADLGIIFDTDVDRAAAVDRKGESINRNELIALIGAIVLEEHPHSTIVTDSITSDGLAEFIDKLGGKHHRFKRGYKNVINEAIRLNNNGEESWLAIETSGHAALKENHFLDDGAYLITKLLIKAAQMRSSNGKDLSELIAGLRVPAESKEFRLKIKADDFKAYGNTVIEQLKDFVASVPGWTIVPNNYEGIRIACDANSGNGWFLLRLSLHDPVIPLNIESDKQGGVAEIAGKLAAFFATYPDKELDKTALII